MVFYYPALVQSIQTVPRIESIWPTSVASWVGLALGVFSMIGVGVAIWKASNRPVLMQIAEAKTYFTKELARVELDFTEKIDSQQSHIDHSLDDYHKTVTNEVNGWAKRFEDDHDDIHRHEDAIGGLAGRLIKSEADREQLNRRIFELTVKVDENTKETRQVERTMMGALADSERRILAAITGKRI